MCEVHFLGLIQTPNSFNPYFVSSIVEFNKKKCINLYTITLHYINKIISEPWRYGVGDCL